MQTVDASLILADAQRALSLDLSQLEQRQKDSAYSSLSLALQEVWDSWWWQELMTAAQMSGASVYDGGTSYAAQAFVYYPATQKFYQALTATVGNPPATFADGTYTTNFAFWGEAIAIPAGPDFLTGTNDTGLPLGSIVRNPTDGLFYQLYAYADTMRVSGAGISGANQVYIRAGTTAGRPAYLSLDSNFLIVWLDGSVLFPPSTSAWVITPNGAGFSYASTSDVASPDLAANWFSISDYLLTPNPANNPPPTVAKANTYNAPPDSSNWGLLTPFVATVSLGGTVRGVGGTDPRNSNNSGMVPFEKIPGGIRIPCWTSGVPWVWYRLPTPNIDATDFDPAASYTAMPATDITFN